MIRLVRKHRERTIGNIVIYHLKHGVERTLLCAQLRAYVSTNPFTY